MRGYIVGSTSVVSTDGGESVPFKGEEVRTWIDKSLAIFSGPQSADLALSAKFDEYAAGCLERSSAESSAVV